MEIGILIPSGGLNQISGYVMDGIQDSNLNPRKMAGIQDSNLVFKGPNPTITYHVQQWNLTLSEWVDGRGK